MNRGLILFLGFVAAMVGAACLCGLMVTIVNGVQVAGAATQRSPHEVASMFLISSVVSLPVVTLGGLLIGLPAHAMMARRGVRDASSYLAAGTITGGVTGPGVIALLLHAVEGIPIAMVFGSAAGFMAALIWWTLVVRTTPDEAARG